MSATTITAADRQTDLASLHPAYFAMVMATGIVSLAAHLIGFQLIASVLFVLNVLFAAVLVALTVARVMRYPQNVVADFQHHGRAVGTSSKVADLHRLP